MLRETRSNLVVVSDLHGCKQAFDRSLRSAFEFINSPYEHMLLGSDTDTLPKFFNESLIVFLGDLIDRGPDSYKIIKSLKHLPNCEYLCGNHESVFFKFLYLDDFTNQWEIHERSMFTFFKFGGIQTLRSFVESGEFVYNKDFIDATYDFCNDDLFYLLEDFYPFIADLRTSIKYNSEIQKFFLNMRLSFQMDNFLCVHAGFLYDYLNLNFEESRPGWIYTLNEAFKNAVIDGMQGDFSKFNQFTTVSAMRGGNDVAGPLWADRKEIIMMTDMNRSRLSQFYSVEGVDTVFVGHSYVDKIQFHNLAEDVHSNVPVIPVKFVFTDTGLSSYYQGAYSSQALVVDQIGKLYSQDTNGKFVFLDK